MQIIVFLNKSFEQFSFEQAESKNYHPIVKRIKKNMQTDNEVANIVSAWEIIYQRFKLSSDFSPAKYLATNLNLDLEHVLMATPVHVKLGLRNSQTYFLQESELANKALIEQFNAYFQNEYFLYQESNKRYLLCANKPLDLSLAKSHWSPNLGDFTLQMLTTDRALRKFHTDVQAWCHSQGLKWNGLYLWGQGQVLDLPKITVKSNYRSDNPFSILHNDNNADKKVFVLDDLRVDNELLTECEFHMTTTQDTHIDFVFSDQVCISIASHDRMAWIKRIFKRKKEW